KKVSVVLLDSNERVDLIQDRAGVWEVALDQPPAELYGQRYQFEVDGVATTDPYAHLLDGDYGPARFVNLAAHHWQDQGFDRGSVTEKLVRRGVSEVHVKDMTAHRSAPVDSPDQRGTYDGLRSKGVMRHLRRLQIGGLEFLPLHE